ncbi:MAG: ABC transporter permease [Coprobacillaceae bacterium]
MNAYWVMLKANIKLVLRNKGYLALVIILPLISVSLLNISMSNTTDNTYEVQESTENHTNITSFEGITRFTIKVYDSADNEESKYFLDALIESGLYYIYRYPSSDMSEQEIEEDAINTANRSSLQALVYISEDFLENDITIYPVGEDARVELLQQQITQTLNIMKNYINASGEVDIAALEQLEINKQIVEVNTSDVSGITIEQQRQQANIAFSLSTMVLGFVFTGVCITSIINYEKDHQVMRRILMVPDANRKYVLVKANITLVTVLLQCLVTMIGFSLFVKIDFGITMLQYTGLIFGIGIIFNLLSVMIGMIIPNIITTSYIVFFIWAASNMLSGVYFPGVDVPEWWEKVSLLMPQKWLLITSESMLGGDSSAVLTYILVIVGFVILIGTLGFFGIRLNEQE